MKERDFKAWFIENYGSLPISDSNLRALRKRFKQTVERVKHLQKTLTHHNKLRAMYSTAKQIAVLKQPKQQEKP